MDLHVDKCVSCGWLLHDSQRPTHLLVLCRNEKHPDVQVRAEHGLVDKLSEFKTWTWAWTDYEHHQPAALFCLGCSVTCSLLGPADGLFHSHSWYVALKAHGMSQIVDSSAVSHMLMVASGSATVLTLRFLK
jgi:hypothetical protein